MIKVSVIYPNGQDINFDMDYYCNSHMKLVADRLGDLLVASSVDAGLAGGAPDEPPAYVAMGHLHFASLEECQAGLGEHAPELLADIPNYTNSEPIIQISEVKM